MSRPMSLACILTSLAIANSVASQQQFLPIGTQIMDGSQSLVTVNLGFTFTMPGGAAVSAVDIDDTGRILEVGIDTSDPTETASKMAALPGGSIAALWDTITYTGDASVWFATDNVSTAVVTWIDVVTPQPCTFQAQLFSDGRIVMVYDDRCPSDDGLIGVCPGNGATIPPEVNLDASITSPLIETTPMVFEDFGITSDNFDLAARALEWIPQGSGGSTGWVVIGNTGVISPPSPFAKNEGVAGGGCAFGVFTPTSYLFSPNGSGGYNVSSSPSLFDPNIGQPAGVTADDTITATQLDLTFPFQWPDGTIEQEAKIDPNGRVLPESASDAGDFTASIAELTGNGSTSICGFWTDINVNEPGSGTVHFSTNPGTSATFTWNGVKQFDAGNASPPMTFQVQLFAGGLIIITHQDITGFNRPGTNPSRDLLVGCGTGAAPDPGELDLTAIGGGSVSTAGGNAYEFWDASAGLEPTDLFTPITTSYPELVANSEPLLGTSWQLQVDNVGAATLGLYIGGVAQQNVDLTPLGSPCSLLVTADVIAVALPNGSGSLQPLSLPVPNSTSLTGASLFVQAAANGAPNALFQPFAGTPWRFAFTNAIKGTLGQ